MCFSCISRPPFFSRLFNALIPLSTFTDSLHLSNRGAFAWSENGIIAFGCHSVLAFFDVRRLEVFVFQTVGLHSTAINLAYIGGNIVICDVFECRQCAMFRNSNTLISAGTNAAVDIVDNFDQYSNHGSVEQYSNSKIQDPSVTFIGKQDGQNIWQFIVAAGMAKLVAGFTCYYPHEVIRARLRGLADTLAWRPFAARFALCRRLLHQSVIFRSFHSVWREGRLRALYKALGPNLVAPSNVGYRHRNQPNLANEDAAAAEPGALTGSYIGTTETMLQFMIYEYLRDKIQDPSVTFIGKQDGQNIWQFIVAGGMAKLVAGFMCYSTHMRLFGRDYEGWQTLWHGVLLQDGRYTKSLIFATLAIVFGSSFQFGFHIGATNIPSAHIERWLNETHANLTGKPGEPIELSTSKFLMGAVAACFALGGMIGGVSVGTVADKFGRRKPLLFNNFVAANCSGAVDFFNKIKHAFLSWSSLHLQQDQEALGKNVFFLFTLLLILFILFAFKFLPETKNKTLEEMQQFVTQKMEGSSLEKILDARRAQVQQTPPPENNSNINYGAMAETDLDKAVTTRDQEQREKLISKAKECLVKTTTEPDRSKRVLPPRDALGRFSSEAQTKPKRRQNKRWAQKKRYAKTRGTPSQKRLQAKKK
ncbi:hypothetical protein niasHT_029157 [Heterodera trifolii]|uniref:Uncharacterized protein n=1 Tax=Heterodera trifolii TaxID=157864 RepID=A0ABD2JYD4_9BILA